MSTAESLPQRPARVYRSAQFKSELIELATAPGASMAGIAVAHGVNPNLLRRWIRESGNQLSAPTFVPVRIEPPLEPVQAKPFSHRQPLEIRIDRGDIHIQFKVDPSQMAELGQVLREVLR